MRKVVWFFVGLATLIALIVGLIIGTGFFLSPQDDLQHADVIVAISGGETSQRTREAVRLYNEGYADTVLFSGAAADRNGPSNAATMRREALEQGVPDDAILIEEDSANTAENATRTAPILHKMGAKSIILVTSPYHQRRASLDFRVILGSSITIINHSATDSAWRKSSWWTDPYTVGLTISELQKTIYVWSTQPKTN